MKKEVIAFNGKSVILNDLKSADLGIETLKLVVEMLISMIDIIKEMFGKKVRFITTIRSLRTIIPFVRTMVKHGKTVLAEIKDLTDDELEEVTQLITEKSDSSNLDDAISFLEFITKLNK